MRSSIPVGGMVLALLAAQPATAQTPAAGEADPGVRPTRLIDRDEVRVSRVEIQPGAVRRVHVHDDVEYHLWIPIDGTLEITIGFDAPIAAASGQAFFLKRGTPHGFKNTGGTLRVVFEIFVKRTTIAGGAGPFDVRALALAFAKESSR